MSGQKLGCTLVVARMAYKIVNDKEKRIKIKIKWFPKVLENIYHFQEKFQTNNVSKKCHVV